MKIWLEFDSQEFCVHTTENPYGTEVEIPDELINELRETERKLGELRRQVLAFVE